MQQTLEKCRAVTHVRLPNGETGARHATDAACFVWYGTDTFGLYFSPKAADLEKEFTSPE